MRTHEQLIELIRQAKSDQDLSNLIVSIQEEAILEADSCNRFLDEKVESIACFARGLIAKNKEQQQKLSERKKLLREANRGAERNAIKVQLLQATQLILRKKLMEARAKNKI